MKKTSLENVLAYNCAPALAGIKPSNIIFCSKKSMPDIHLEIQKLNHLLNSKNIHLEIMCECDRRISLMAYRRDKLEKHLQNPELKEFLKSFGYPEEASFNDTMSFLKERLREDCFPHEIGVFLGYPLHDIIGYMNHRDEGCLFTGDWKVYANVDEAKELFARFKACRNGICRRMSCGCSLAQVFCAAS